jgi:hypothetical protein
MCSSRAMKFISVLAFVGILALGFTTLSFAQTSGQTPGVQPPQSSGDVSKDSAAPPKATAKPDSSFGQKPGMPAGQSMADPSKNSAGKPKATDTSSSSFGQKPGMPAGQSMADPSKNSLKPGADSNVGNAPYPDYGKQGGTYNR